MGKLLWVIFRAQWDRALAVVAVAFGLLALLLGWLGVSDTEYPAEQIPYVVSGGLLGIFLLGQAAVLWISADMRDEWRKLDDLSRQLAQLGAPVDSDAPAMPEPTPAVEVADSPDGERTGTRRARKPSRV